jgi:glycosyltransferase involved in cell wall biosynthesis
MRILHAIHDFLPRHQAGSEIYAFNLCTELARRHVVHVVAGEYDPARPHGTLTWRVHRGLPVIELVNNWAGSFSDTWRSERLGAQLTHALRATQPDVLHVHSLLNLTFDLPALARSLGIPVVATLHDHTLSCPAGGQRLHLGDHTVCESIQPARCATCFPLSPFYSQMTLAGATRLADPAGLRIGAIARSVVRRAPRFAAFLGRHVRSGAGSLVSEADITARLEGLRTVFESVQLFVAPSRAVADAHVRLGLPPSKIVVSDYGFVAKCPHTRRAVATGERVRIGFVGTLAWHKGIHVLLEAARLLSADHFELEIWGNPTTFPEYTARLTALARGLPVQFRGEFDQANSAAIYGRFDLLAVPSLWPENSPLVIHEAFLAGVPVVAARSGGIPELVSDGVNGVLYEPSSPASLAHALQALLDHPARIAAMAARVPPVKTIEQDARDWERRYDEVRRPWSPARMESRL